MPDDDQREGDVYVRVLKPSGWKGIDEDPDVDKFIKEQKQPKKVSRKRKLTALIVLLLIDSAVFIGVFLLLQQPEPAKEPVPIDFIVTKSADGWNFSVIEGKSWGNWTKGLSDGLGPHDVLNPENIRYNIANNTNGSEILSNVSNRYGSNSTVIYYNLNNINMLDPGDSIFISSVPVGNGRSPPIAKDVLLLQSLTGIVYIGTLP